MDSQCKRPRSSLYTILPRVVRSRIPVLSFRSLTPSTAPTFALLPRSLSAPADLETDGRDSPESSSTGIRSRPNTPESDPAAHAMTTGSAQPAYIRSGVNWDMASHGCRTWLAARSMAQQDRTDPAQLRALHIDAVRYMAMSLPEDLTEAEARWLRQAVPQAIQNLQFSPVEDRSLSSKHRLRSGIASLTCWLIAMIMFLIPFFMVLLNKALVLERQYQITERVMAQSLDLNTMVSDRLASSIHRFCEGYIMQSLLSTSTYLLESITGGVLDGFHTARAVTGAGHEQ